MDAIDRAIKNNLHRYVSSFFQKRTWNDFAKEISHKRLFVFGVGQGARIFCHTYQEFDIDGFIDNDEYIQGCFAHFFLDVPMSAKNKKARIFGIKYLSQLRADDIVVLISNIADCQPIAEQLLQYGITNCFSFLCMEADRRQKLKTIETKELPPVRPFWESNLVPIQPNKIILLTMLDGAGHGKEIIRNLLCIRKDLEIVWLTKDHTANLTFPPGVHTIPLHNHRAYLYALATAKLWIFDGEIPWEMQKRKGQYYLILNHWSSITLKFFGFDLATYRKDAGMIKAFSAISQMIDYIVVGSPFDERTSRRGYNFHGSVVMAGSPRSDALFRSEECKNETGRVYGISKQKKWLLYAPTFRSKSEIYQPRPENIDLDFELVKWALEERFGEEWMILLRLHPAVSEFSKNIPILDYVVDVSDYYDSEELVAASDALITDYSSIMFEPAHIRRPVFLFATDREEYLQKERGFFIDYDALPFPIAESNEKLVHNIITFDAIAYKNNVTTFFEKFGVHEDGHAGARAAMFVSDLMDGKTELPYLRK